MKIAVIGTGNVGKALGGTLVRAGHDVTFAARDAGKTRTCRRRVRCPLVDLGRPGCRRRRRRRPRGSVRGRSGGRRRDPAEVAGKLVIDATNPAKPDYSGLVTEGGPSAGERLAELLPEARVGKAFNTLFASIQADPGALGTTLDGFLRDRRRGRARAAGRSHRVGRLPAGPRRLDRGSARARGSCLAEHPAAAGDQRRLALRIRSRRSPGRGDNRCHGSRRRMTTPGARLPALYLGHGAPPLLEDPTWTAQLGWLGRVAPATSCT